MLEGQMVEFNMAKQTYRRSC